MEGTKRIYVAAALASGMVLGIWTDRAIHHPEFQVCAITRTTQDVGWRDTNGITHDFLPMCTG